MTEPTTQHVTRRFWNSRLGAPIVPYTSSGYETRTRKGSLHIEFSFFIVFVALLFSLQFVPKGAMVLWFNAHYTPFWNTFFKYFTHLGDGLVFVPLCLSLLWVRYGYAAIAAITGVVLALLSNIFKHLVFSDFSRPKAWFAEAGLLQFVEGVTIHSRNAFPSGHTATAAAVAILLALFIRNRYATAGLLLYALLVAMSRVYLAQHFFQDVVFGFLEGAAAGALVYHIAAKFWKGA